MSAVRHAEFGIRNGNPTTVFDSAFRIPHSTFRAALSLVTCHLSLLVVLLSQGGCAVLSVPFQRLSELASTPVDVLDDGYEDYAGVLHVHTTYSHDADGRFDDVVHVANEQHLDYAIVTDHNTLQPLRDGRQGWHGRTLVLIGMEISADGGHYLAFNVTKEIDREHLTTQQVIDEVNRQGGFGFIAHPYFKKRPWTDWGVSGFTGIEAYNVVHDAIDENRLRLALWTLGASAEAFYDSILDRPYDPLAMWDRLIARHGRVVGIGSTDAHEVHLMGMTFAPYEMLFRLARTHVLVPSTTLTAEGVYEALRKGHAYFSIELHTPAKGFSFVAQQGQRVLGVMGDEVTLVPDLQLAASLPTAAELTLFRDGQPAAHTIAPVWQVPITLPGTYRVEATRHGRPWIFSNPIYVVRLPEGMPGEEPALSTQQ